jgi:hypothetical protein
MRRLHRTVVVTGVLAVVTCGAAGTAAAYYALTSVTSTTTHLVSSLTAPLSLTATASLAGQDGVVDLSWAPPASPAGAIGVRYTVLRGDVPVCSGIVDTVCRDTALAPGSSQTWTVRASLGAWTGPSTTTSATLPVARALSVVAPSAAIAGTPFDVVVTATDRGAPDTSAVGRRTLTVNGPSGIAANTPTTSVTVDFAVQADGSVSGTAPVTLVAAETTALTLSEASVPGRSGTSGPVIVAPQQGASAFADCQGPPGYSCGSRTPLADTTLTGVVQRDAVDPLGNPLPLPADTVTLTLKNDRKADVTQVVVFEAGQTSSQRWTFQPEPGANGNVTVTATAPSGRTVPAPLTIRL